MRLSLRLWLSLAPLSLAWMVFAGCSDDKPKPLAADGGRNGGRAGTTAAANGGEGGGEGLQAPGGAGGNGGSLGEAGAAPGGAPPQACNDGKGAVISGRILAPNGMLPLGGVTVYVPSATVDPLPNGASCFRCESAFNGVPIAKAVTAADGRFEIIDAPVGERVPLVVQTGKWRRSLELQVADCQESVVDEAASRLPRRQSEGNLPAIALVSGGEDTLECLLRKLGVDDREFTFMADAGRVRLYQGKGGISQISGVEMSQLPAPAALWPSLHNFDLVLLGSELDQNVAQKPAPVVEALHNYAAAGGRVLLQHFQNYFLSAGSEAVSSVATFQPGPDLPDPFTATVDESSARGKALADSLLAAAPETARGSVRLSAGKNTVKAVQPPALPLIAGTMPTTVQAFSLELPLGEDASSCGRITETEILTASGDTIADFPTGCTSQTLSAQEQALAYLIFDLGACLP